MSVGRTRCLVAPMGFWIRQELPWGRSVSSTRASSYFDSWLCRHALEVWDLVQTVQAFVDIRHRTLDHFRCVVNSITPAALSATTAAPRWVLLLLISIDNLINVQDLRHFTETFAWALATVIVLRLTQLLDIALVEEVRGSLRLCGAAYSDLAGKATYLNQRMATWLLFRLSRWAERCRNLQALGGCVDRRLHWEFWLANLMLETCWLVKSATSDSDTFIADFRPRHSYLFRHCAVFLVFEYLHGGSRLAAWSFLSGENVSLGNDNGYWTLLLVMPFSDAHRVLDYRKILIGVSWAVECAYGCSFWQIDLIRMAVHLGDLHYGTIVRF